MVVVPGKRLNMGGKTLDSFGRKPSSGSTRAAGPKAPADNIDWWVKVVEMLQQSWAVVDEVDGRTRVRFIDDVSRIFDEMSFSSVEEAIAGLRRNGFSRCSDEPEHQKFIRPPLPPFRPGIHPSGPIYSSGRFWI